MVAVVTVQRRRGHVPGSAAQAGTRAPRAPPSDQSEDRRETGSDTCLSWTSSRWTDTEDEHGGNFLDGGASLGRGCLASLNDLEKVKAETSYDLSQRGGARPSGEGNQP